MTTPNGARPLAGQVAWVTGAGRGLGRAIATAMAEAGATVAVTARTEADLVALRDELSRAGAYVLVLPGSIADSATVASVVRTITAATGRLDTLVNCAAISPVFTRSEGLSDADWRHVLEVNLHGTFVCCREAGAVMLAQESGSIINVTSVHAQTGFERIAAYAAAKGGVEALTRTLAVEWATRGVRVNSLAPGYFRTDLSSGLLASRWRERVLGGVPMGRVGEPPELTGAAVFLASDAASYVTGSTLVVDGGWTAW
jgi:NAD(P)-dependent dehydrogenase (short-subunit alcohol dehydrogenase family)